MISLYAPRICRLFVPTGGGIRCPPIGGAAPRRVAVVSPRFGEGLAPAALLEGATPMERTISSDRSPVVSTAVRQLLPRQLRTYPDDLIAGTLTRSGSSD
jgi:hypothetical protein